MRPRVRPIDVTLPEYGIFVLESHHAPGFRMAPSRHDFLEVFYVLEGAGSFRIAENGHPCSAGDVIVVPPGAVHQIEDSPTQPLALYGICVAPAVYRTLGELADVLPAGRLSVPELLRPQLRAGLRQMLFEQTLAWPGHQALLTGLALQLLGLLQRSRTAPRPLVAAPTDHHAAVQQYVAELARRFFEPADLDQVAARLGMSRRRFTQLFRAVTGTSWLDYLTGLRIDYACQLLRQTPRSITAIAFECGYEELSSFYRAFRRRTGVPPSDWRRRQG